MHAGTDTWSAMYDEANSYQRKHVAHVENCNILGPKIDESLKDIAIYSMIMLYMHNQARSDR